MLRRNQAVKSEANLMGVPKKKKVPTSSLSSRFSFRIGGHKKQPPTIPEEKTKKPVKGKVPKTNASSKKKQPSPAPTVTQSAPPQRPRLVKTNSNPSILEQQPSQTQPKRERKARRFSIGTPTAVTTPGHKEATTAPPSPYQPPKASSSSNNRNDPYARYENGINPRAMSSPTIPEPASPQGYTTHQVMDYYYQDKQQQQLDALAYPPSMPPLSETTTTTTPQPRAPRPRMTRRGSLDTAMTMISEPVSTKTSRVAGGGRKSNLRRASAAYGRAERPEESLNYSTAFLAQQAADMDKQANELSKAGQYEKAFMLYERALELKRSMLQTDQAASTPPQIQTVDQQTVTPDQESEMAGMLASVATSINNMTYLRQRGGQATADETMAAYIKSLQIKREILGPDHLSVGKTLSNIGSVFYLKKEYVPALKAFENALEIMTAQMGEGHLEVGTVLSNLADVHFAMRHPTEALDYYKRAIDVRWVPLGRNDPKVVRLLKRAALLETGQQPEKDDFSDSDDEEYMEQDRQRRQDLQQDVQALREEVDRDIREINLEIFNQRSSTFLPKDDEEAEPSEAVVNVTMPDATAIPKPRAASMTVRAQASSARNFHYNSHDHDLSSSDDSDSDDSSSYDSDGSLSVNSAPPDLHY